MKNDGRKFNKKKICIIIFVMLLALGILAAWIYYHKIRVVQMAMEIYKNDCHMAFEYHVDYNTQDNDEEEGLIKSLGTGSDGFVSLDKSGKQLKGTCYDPVSGSEFFQFYKDSDEFYFNIKSILKAIISRLDKDKESKVYNNVVNMNDYYLTANQIKEMFDIEINSIDINWSQVAKQASKFKKCDPPTDVHTSVDVSRMDFYSVSLEDEDVVLGIPKGVRKKSNLVYISVVKETMRFELYGTLDSKENIELEAPDTALDEEALKKINKKYNLAKDILELLIK